MPVERKPFNLPSVILVIVLIIFGGSLVLVLSTSDFETGAKVHRVFNLVEGVLWVGIGIVLLWRSRSPQGVRFPIIVAGVTFILFGISDFIEIRTGSWFEPPWLLLWKVGCVVSLVSCLIWYLVDRRKET